MASVREPANPLEKRDLLHADSPKADRIDAIAEKLLAEGRNSEAIDYIEITRTPALLQRVHDLGLAAGSPFLLQQWERLSGTKAGPDLWQQVSRTAAEAGRFMDAVRALRLCDMDEEAEALRLAKCPDFDPFRPDNK
jgi:hypothetical protein